MPSDRLQLAERFLEEAVYRSRGLQAVRVGLLGGTPSAPSGPGNCGLGKEAAVDLELTERGAELFAQIWTGTFGEARREHLRMSMESWVNLQDSLDRKRNHFIRDFRRNNGADRREYTEGVATDYDAGIEGINREVRGALRSAAQELLD